jgi:hypothetical protein
MITWLGVRIAWTKKVSAGIYLRVVARRDRAILGADSILAKHSPRNAWQKVVAYRPQ